MIRDELHDILGDKPITRREIRNRTRYHDRDIRQAIRDLRLAGVRVVTASNGGYFIAKTEEDYIPFRNAMVSRVVEIMKVVNAMDRNINGQVRWSECTGVQNTEQ